MGDPRPTMRDVAARAGVGVGTVSRVVNGGTHVSPAMRQRVEAAIAEIGFSRNEVARMLRPGQASSTIGLIIDDLRNPFSSELANGAAAVVSEHNHVLLIGTTQLDSGTERELVEEFIRRRVDGLLIVTSGMATGPGEAAALDSGTPVVYVDRTPAKTAFDSVELDNTSGVRQALGGLIAAGHRRIAYVGGDPAAATGGARMRAYRMVLQEADVPLEHELVSTHNSTAEAACASTVRLLQSDRPPTAIFCDNNRMTHGVIQAFTALGTTVALAGFDDLELADLLPFEVDLVVYAPAEMGRRAAVRLFDRIAGDRSARTKYRVATHIERRGRRFHRDD